MIVSAPREAVLLLNEIAGVAYIALGALILLQAKRSPTGLLLAACCGCTAAWAIASASRPFPLTGLAGALDCIRAAAWFGFVLHLYRRAMPGPDATSRLFALAGLGVVLGTAGVMLVGGKLAPDAVSLSSAGLALRLFVALAELLLLENLYRNTTDALRWILQVTCIALGGLAAYDVVMCADAALFHRFSLTLIEGRPLVACMVVPLIALAAARNQRWAVGIHVSRSAVFYSASLIVSGVFLLALAAAGEALRQFRFLSQAGLSQWGSVAQVCLVFAGLITIAVVLTSTTSRSRLRAILVDHFFTHRYDYRREWLRCIETLSGDDPSLDVAPAPLDTRAVRALAQLVDSPAGVLLLRDAPEADLQWAGAWNVPPAGLHLAKLHPLTRRLEQGKDAIPLADQPELAVWLGGGDARHPALPAWLAIPLRRSGLQDDRLDGCILVAPPRATFKLDAEVFDLLRTVGSEVATYLAEQRAARVLIETRELRDYGKRFAFVAHDIKNVSSQLSLLLSNAETHLANPEFQRDMLVTVRASVQKIGALIQRLQSPEAAREGGTLVPALRLQALADAVRPRGVPVLVEQQEQTGAIAMDPAAFDMVVTHLLDNAIDATEAASAGARPITVRLGREAGLLSIDITDQGCGMTPAFIRDELFRPFGTSKPQGSGIGAFQARELLRAAGGNLMVFSEQGSGTTMRLLLPLAGSPIAAAAA
jgi:putative PEP-CTERM system histidine kinase